jgi:glycosyltransferase involved in cell wall biosynthesis
VKVMMGNDTYPPDVNGAAYFTKRLAVALADRGHEVHVLCPSRNLWSGVMTRDGVVEYRTRSLPVPFHSDFRFSPPPFLRRRVLEEVRRTQPDVVHAQGHLFIGRALIRAAKQLGVPVVATNHFMPDNLVFYLHLPERIEQKVTEWAWRDFSRVFDRADLVTAPTSFAAELAEVNGLSRPIFPVSCGMDLSRFSPTNDGYAFKTRYGVPERPNFMYVGRLDVEKHVDELIRALPLVRKFVGTPSSCSWGTGTSTGTWSRSPGGKEWKDTSLLPASFPTENSRGPTRQRTCSATRARPSCRAS